MSGKFQWCKFSECNITDHFFVSLIKDYSDSLYGLREKARKVKKLLYSVMNTE